MVVVTGFFLMVGGSVWGELASWGQMRLDGVLPLVAWCALELPVAWAVGSVVLLAGMTSAVSVVNPFIYLLAFLAEYLLIRHVLSNVSLQDRWQKALVVAGVAGAVEVILMTGSGHLEEFLPWGVAQGVLYGVTAPAWFWLFDVLASGFVPSRGDVGGEEG